MQPKRLLMIDDDPAMGDFVRNVAIPLGYAVETYVEARGFKSSVVRADPDVIILDLSMPETDGIELMRFLAETGTRAKIFIMSGFGTKFLDVGANLGRAHGLTIVDIVPKPVRVAELRKILSQQLSDQ